MAGKGSWSVLLVLLLVAGGISVTFWPGHLDADGLQQIQQARSGHFSDWYAPILDWLWRDLFRLGGSPGIVLFCTVALTVLAIYELLRIDLSRQIALPLTIAIVLFPPVFGFLGSLQRDTWFGAFTLSAYALSAKASLSVGKTRPLFGALAVVACWLSAASRPNALIAVVPALVIASTFILPRRLYEKRDRSTGHEVDGRGQRWARWPVVGILLVAIVVSQRVLTYDVIGAARAHPEQVLYDQDLAGLSIRSGKNLFPEAVLPSQNLEEIRRFYSPYTVLPLIGGHDHPLVYELDGTSTHMLYESWVQAVKKDPVGYLHIRWRLWARLIAWSGNSYEPYHPGFDSNPWGYRATFPVLDRVGVAYLRTSSNAGLQGGLLHRVWVYLVLAPFMGLTLLWNRKRQSEVAIVGWMAIGAFFYTMTFFFGAMGQGFRWNWFLVTTTVIAVVLMLAKLIRRALAFHTHSQEDERTDPKAPLLYGEQPR
jgi:hypothetical protein